MYFIGTFVHATNQEEVMEADRRHGEFSMVVDEETPVAALKRFRDKIVNYRATSDFFQGDCSVYLIQLFEFDQFPVDEAIMLNYKSTAGDPLMPFIRCSMPNDVTDSCRLFDWENNAPEIDGKKEKLFLAFEAGSTRVLAEPDDAFKLSEPGAS
ncbi:MAG: hypothetical protein LJE94_12135 [Deltaproteobacteria bacterium]|jgi:hypothetical protein|nr:hypothetical protein [Deltaproteobacteria bacterium]